MTLNDNITLALPLFSMAHFTWFAPHPTAVTPRMRPCKHKLASNVTSLGHSQPSQLLAGHAWPPN